MEFSDIMVVLLITAGATKAAAMFLAQGAGLTRAERMTVAFRAVAIQAGVLGSFAAFGSNILGFFHVSVAALEVAGGLILLLFGIGLVLGEEHEPEAGKAGNVGIAVYPLAMPLLASPQAIVAVTIASTMLGPGNLQPLWLALCLILAMNAVVMFGIARMGGKPVAADAKPGFSLAPVILRVVALLLCGLAIEIMVLGLRGYGILPPKPPEALSAVVPGGPSEPAPGTTARDQGAS